MSGNLTLASAPWLELFLVLALGGTIIVALAAAVASLTRSAPWQRTLWQAATLGLVFLVAVELSGLGRGLSWLCSPGESEPAEPPNERPRHNVLAAPAVADVSREVEGSTPGNPWEPDVFRPEGSGPVRRSANDFYETTFPETEPIEPAAFARAATEPTALQLATPAEETRASGPWEPPVESFARADPTPPTTAPEPGVTPDTTPGDKRIAEKPVAPDTPGQPLPVPWWPAAIWGAGAVLLLGRMVWARLLLLLFRWRRTSRCDAEQSEALAALAGRLGLRRGIRIVQSERLSAPVAFGWLRPTVAVPVGFFEEFDAREQRAMLVHELAHLAAGDPVWQAVSDLLCALMWWHPMVWWSRFRLQAVSEAAADEASLLVPDGPDVLAGCLVAMGRRISGGRLGWVSIRGPGFRSALGRRVQRLLQLGPRKWRPPGPGRAASARLVLPALLVLAAVFSTSWARPQETTPEGGTTMSVWQSCVGRSVAASVLWALMGPAVNEAPAEQPAPGDPAVAVEAGDLDLAGLLLAQRDDEGERREGDRPRGDREQGERERGERERPRTEGDDREEGERERGEGDRPRGEGDRERGEREHPEARRDREEGEREHPEARRDHEEGEREHPEARRDREEGEREHPEARRDREEGEREHPEARREREGEKRQHPEARHEREGSGLAEFEEHLHGMMREREELVGRGREIQHILRELGEGQPERAGGFRRELERIEREVRELNGAIEGGRRELEGAHVRRRVEELKRQIHELSEAGRHEDAERLKQEGRRMWAEFEARQRGEDMPGRPGPPHPELEQRIHHLRVAIDNLRAAGMHEAAQRLVEQSERFMREHAPGVPHPPHRPDPHRPDRPPHPEHPDRPPMPERAMHQVEQLRNEVQQMREEMQELRETLKRLIDREREER